MKLGIDRLLADTKLRAELRGRRVALLGHQASVNSRLEHSLHTLSACPEIELSACFGPQHGMLGDKQDNMVESGDYLDPQLGIPVFSLYGEVRKPTREMLDSFDLLLVDLQDIGCRIYTYITTLVYMMEACAREGKALWVLDRPNPAGRVVEGSLLEDGWESFVGASQMLMRHGLTMGEIASWYLAKRNLSLEFRVVEMEDYRPELGPGWGWPVGELSWVNPSPNASSLNMARAFSGTVLLEGTTLSEGRGTSNPLEVVGAPDLDFELLLRRMQAQAPEWLGGCRMRGCYFEPTFHKYQGELCQGLQIHTDYSGYNPLIFKPYRLIALLLKSIRREVPDYTIWRVFPYEYETERLAIDLLSGGDYLRKWVDDQSSAVADLEAFLLKQESLWLAEIEDYLIYP